VVLQLHVLQGPQRGGTVKGKTGEGVTE